MLEKALLLCKEDKSIKDAFDSSHYLELNDERLLHLLDSTDHDVKHLLPIGETGKLYQPFLKKELEKVDYSLTAEFLEMLIGDPDELSDTLSCQLNESLGSDQYTFICDIVTSKSPKDINLDEKDPDGEQVLLSQKSDVVRAIQPISVLKVYARPGSLLCCVTGSWWVLSLVDLSVSSRVMGLCLIL